MRIHSILTLTSLALLVGTSNPPAAHEHGGLAAPESLVRLRVCLDELETVQAGEVDRLDGLLRTLEDEIVALRSDDRLPPALLWSMTHHLEVALSGRLALWERQILPASHSIHQVDSSAGASRWNVTIGRGYVLSGSAQSQPPGPASREFRTFLCRVRHQFAQVVHLRERQEAELLRDAVRGQ